MKKWIAALAFAVAWFASAGAWAADAKELRIAWTIKIKAPPEAVWAYVGDFNGLPRWLPTIADSKIVLGENNKVGAIRQFTRRNGTKASERLIDYDPTAMRIGYTYVDGTIMASDYFPVIQVIDNGDGTSTVRWTARFKRIAYAEDPPPAGQEDQAMLDMFNKTYKMGLEYLRTVVETEQKQK